MRREPWFGVGLLLAAIAEIQWGGTFYGQTPSDLLHAAELFVAGAAFLLASAGVFFNQDAWTWQLGLGLAAAAHVAYFATTLSFGPLLILAAVLAAAGLAVAAWGTRAPGNPNLVRIGLFGAMLAAALWVVSDAMSGSMAFMVGNVFALVGWAGAAAFVPEKVA